MPVLDIKVKVNCDEMNRIDFEFYEKPTRNPIVILASSALSYSKKRTILTQECLRRLRNTKVELGPEVQNKYLNLFMLKVKNSGYTEKFRTEVLDSGMKAFKTMLEDDKNGVKPLYSLGQLWSVCVFEYHTHNQITISDNIWHSTYITNTLSVSDLLDSVMGKLFEYTYWMRL